MNKCRVLIFAALLVLGLYACAPSPSAIDQLTKNVDPVEALIIPEGAEPLDEPAMGADEASPDEDPELKALRDLKGPPPQKLVIITGNKVPLRKGPGTKYKKSGSALKGEEYNFLREIRTGENSPIWYLVEDAKGNKHFLPKLFAILIDMPPSPAAAAGVPKPEQQNQRISEKVKKGSRLRAENVRHVIDPTPPLPPELVKAKHITLNFEGTDIYDVITTFCELLKLDYMVEGNIQGKVTLQTFNQIPAKDLFPVFEQILAVANVTVIKSGNFYRFLPLPDAPRKPLSIYYGNDPLTPSMDRVVIQVIPLRYVSNNAMKQVITPLLSTAATLVDVPETRNLMLIDLGSNVKKVLKVIRAVDIDKLSASDIQLFEMKFSDAAVVTDELVEIFTSMGYKKALGESLTFLPITRLNAVLVVNSLEDVMETVEFWVSKLDQPMTGGNLSTFVYYVQNAEAESLAGILNSIFADSPTDKKAPAGQRNQTPANAQAAAQQARAATNPRTGAPQAAPLRVEGGIQAQVEGDLTIIPDKDTNSLVVRTAAKNYPGLLELIKKLDLLPQQVVIEVLILDLTIDEQTRTGLRWALQGGVDGKTLAGGTTGLSPPTLGSELGMAATPLFASGASFFAGNPDKLVALLEAFASDSKANIVANPILVTSDNKEATISITDDIPIQSATLTTNTQQPVTSTTIEFRSVGIKLGILPKINSDNFVNLKINQEISNQGPEFQGTPSFTTRVVNTEVVLRDNQVLVMGGLMRTTTTESVSGVPLLMDIPWLGRFFSIKDDSVNKTELMLFITPHIISNIGDSQNVTDHFRNRLGSLIKKSSFREGG
ncbi:MAG: type II secretion system secretin GspD [Nitrospinaceae bacterium]